MANITELYERLDTLGEQATAIAEDFAESGDLVNLQKDLNTLANECWSTSNAAGTIGTALKFEE